MLHLKNLSDKYQKRLLRGEYVNTQGTPYDVTIDSSLYNTDGSFRQPLAADTTPFTRSANAFVLKNGLVPGTCMVRTTAETVAVATGGNVAEETFGLLANFIGGNMDDIGDERKIGVWRGPDSTYTILAPGFDDTGLATQYATTANTGISVPLYAGTDGRLKYLSSPGNRLVVARLIDRPSAARITVDLKV